MDYHHQIASTYELAFNLLQNLRRASFHQIDWQSIGVNELTEGHELFADEQKAYRRTIEKRATQFELLRQEIEAADGSLYELHGKIAAYLRFGLTNSIGGFSSRGRDPAGRTANFDQELRIRFDQWREHSSVSW